MTIETYPAGWVFGLDVGSHSECHGNRGQLCPFHLGKPPLECVNDYTVGGSHYWHLRCPDCSREYAYDTYTMSLQPVGWP